MMRPAYVIIEAFDENGFVLASYDAMMFQSTVFPTFGSAKAAIPGVTWREPTEDEAGENVIAVGEALAE